MARANLITNFRAFAATLSHPVYLLVALGIGFLIFTILLWFFNLALLVYISKTPVLDVWGRLEFISGSYLGVLGNLSNLNAAAMLIFSALAGAYIAGLIYLSKLSGAKGARRGYRATGIALLGSGCAACGGSIIAPILSGLASPLANAVSQLVGFLAYSLAILIIMRALYKLGGQMQILNNRSKVII